jgi:phage tail sheath protein FI
MPPPLTPGIYVKEVATGPRPIGAVGTSTAAFIGITPDPKASLNEAVPCNNWTEFQARFCADAAKSTDLALAVFGYFMNGGGRCFVLNVGSDKASLVGDAVKRSGLYAFDAIDEIAIVVAPGYTGAADYDAILTHCERCEDRVAILDAPADAGVEALKTVASEGANGDSGQKKGARPRDSDGGYGAVYFPHIIVRDPLGKGETVVAPPSGHIAGIYARTDAQRGVHKAPANEAIRGATGLTYRLSRDEQGQLNSAGVDCIRFFADSGIRVWGARTLAPAASEWRYVNVRRLFNMIKESIAEGTKWTVFEPNDATLWGGVIRDVSAFLTTLWREGALFGATPAEAFFVKCDAENNPPESRDQGQLIVDIGIAPVKPAEFVTFRIGQWAGNTATTSGGEEG